MPRPKRILLIAALVFLGAGLFWWFHREPAYDGRTLSEWLPDLGSATPAVRDAATEAVLALGDRALPHLIRKATARDSPILRELDRVSKLQTRFEYDYSPATIQRNQALLAFEVLGPRAEAAIPTLAGMLSQSDLPMEVALALARIGPKAMPSLVEALDAADPEVRAAAIRVLSESTLAPPDFPERLIRAVDDPHPTVRFFAARALFKSPVHAGEAIPALARHLSDSSGLVRRYAAHALGAYGTLASDQETALRGLFEDSDPQVQRAASNAVDRVTGRLRGDAGLLPGEEDVQ